jgi:hypothetical protein
VTIDIQDAALTFAQEVQDILDSVLPRPDDVPPKDRQVQVLFMVATRSGLPLTTARSL